MPNRAKRKAPDFDPTKSDSDDSTYGASTSKQTKSKIARSQRGKPARKRQRRHSDDESEDISDESEISPESASDVEQEEPEIDERTGRPKRKAAKQRVRYEESDDEDFMRDLEAERVATPKKKLSGRSLVVKLHVRTPQATPAPSTKRDTRARSGSLSARPTSSEMIPTRRSSRIAHDETEDIVALTTSGRHEDVVRPGTRSPEAGERARKGGKGLKSLPTSVVYEEEESSGQTGFSIADSIQADVAASRDDLEDSADEQGPDTKSDTRDNAGADTSMFGARDFDNVAVIPESGDEGNQGEVEDDDGDEEEEEEEEEEEDPISQPGRITRQSEFKHTAKSPNGAHSPSGSPQQRRRSLRSTREKVGTRKSQRNANQESSDFEPGIDDGAEEDVSGSEASSGSPRKASQHDDDNSSVRGRINRTGKRRSRSRRAVASDERDSEEAEELAEELQDLQSARPRRAARAQILFDDKPKTRARKPVDYRILRPDLTIPMDDDGSPSATTPSRRARGGGGAWQRSLYTTYGPFGGGGGPVPVFGGPGGIGAAAGADTDSSDDDDTNNRARVHGIGGTLGLTPTTAVPPGFGVFNQVQTYGADPLQGVSATPAPNVGKLKDKAFLADADPLGIDPNVNFDSVGGLQGQIDQLKEMVALPLLYPEIFQRFHVTPPRGVLFHGPPGTGKTLLARALASSVSTEGRKVTFYMRKGADALSKWVGEAEKQLRLLFDEARKTQPSIIFFDEIDGLAPVRSSKQEQIHSSIVSTLLALMDGMDGRGQVIVIGATNRPDSVDPALRRPGRFDREFYFPLPNLEARRAILDIHTKGWQPPLSPKFKNEIASLTKGYGGADLRALCTEAALNAVQRRYPQIYRSNEKLMIHPETINVTAKDFMISVKKMVPSSERSASSGAAPLPAHIEPLLRKPLANIENAIADILPQKRRLTALEEAEFEDAEDDRGMTTERMQQEFERSRVFRPRLLVKGDPGMGQQYLAAALLNHFEGLHVQAFDLSTLLSDSSRSPEATVIQLFTEVRRHKPSVIYIPNVDIWYRTVGDQVISTFTGLLKALAPTDPVLVLGVLENDEEDTDPVMIKKLFGYSRKNQYAVERPREADRYEYFKPIAEYLNTSPADFPEPSHRKKRRIETLMPVPPEPPKVIEPSKVELKAQKKRDRQLLNVLKVRIQPIMNEIKRAHKRFRTGIIDESQIRYLYEEEDPSILTTDLPHDERRQDERRPYEKGTDSHGEPGLIERDSGKFFYNLETVTIEKRLSNGYYKRPKDFLTDIKKLVKDAKASGDPDRLLKANELQTNVEVDIANIEMENTTLMAELELVWSREMKRERDMIEKVKQTAEAEGRTLAIMPSKISLEDGEQTTEQSSGPIVLGQPIANGVSRHQHTPSNPSQPSVLTNGYSGGLSDLSDLHNRPHSNGTSFPSGFDLDASMSTSHDTSPGRDTQSSSLGQSAQTRPFHDTTGGPASLEQRKSFGGSLSQRSFTTPMVEGSNPHDYANYASTTSSDKKASGSSGPLNTQGNTQNSLSQGSQSSQGKPEGPDLSMIPEVAPPHSQLPETQNFQSSGSPSSSQSSSNSQPPSSQPPPPAIPAFHRASNITALLNTDEDSSPPHPRFLFDLKLTNLLHGNLVRRTSGCSVEQLEQVYSALMDTLWKTRGDWNRVGVAKEIGSVLENVLDDMRHCQDFAATSMELEGLYQDT
ncbi:MAG: hypothetical protein Q9195_001008 [Heterodermia aff. obscurata]